MKDFIVNELGEGCVWICVRLEWRYSYAFLLFFSFSFSLFLPFLIMRSSVGTNQAGHAVLKLMQFSDRLTPGSEV